MSDVDRRGVHAVELSNIGGGDVRITLLAEECQQGCGERVRYWNGDGPDDGYAACGCCHEGPEMCAGITYSPEVRALLVVALAQVDAATGGGK